MSNIPYLLAVVFWRSKLYEVSELENYLLYDTIIINLQQLCRNIVLSVNKTFICGILFEKLE